MFLSFDLLKQQAKGYMLRAVYCKTFITQLLTMH